MKCFHKLAFYILILVVILSAGCTQPETNLLQPISPASTTADTSLKELSPQITQTASSGEKNAEGTDTEVLNRGTADPDFIVDISVPE